MTSRPHESPHFDAGRYPQTYAFARSTQWFLVCAGLLVFAGCLSGALFFGFIADMPAPGGSVVHSLLAAFAVLGLYLAAGARSYRVILGADGIDVVEVLRRRHLERANIVGRRRLVNPMGAAWILVPKPEFGRKLQLSTFLEVDRDFSDWMLSLPDLDGDKKAIAGREIREATDALKARGFDTAAIERLRRLATWFRFVPYAVGIGVYLLPNSYQALTWTSVALPWVAVALVARFQPFYRFGGPKKSPLPDLSLPLMIPGFLLTLQVLNSMSPVGWRPTFALSMVFGFALAAATMRVDPWLRKHRGSAALLTLFCLVYGYGAGLEVNALLDRSPPMTYPVVVQSKRASHGKGTSYHLGLQAWGPFHTGQDVMVPAWRYRQTRIGDTVCVALRAGALGVAWYTVTSCSNVRNLASDH